MVETETIKGTSDRYQWAVEVIHHAYDQFLFKTTHLTKTEKEVGFNDYAINSPFNSFGET